MQIPGRNSLQAAARKGRQVLQRAFPVLGLRFTRRLPGAFQPYNHTLPDRYPWLFGFAAAELAAIAQPRILSFGCSRGEEVFSLRRYLPTAAIKGIDVDPKNIACCIEGARTRGSLGLSFENAASSAREADESYDAIFCLAVLCLGDLTVRGATRSDPQLYFTDFSRAVADLARCLKPGGLLLLQTTSYRFGDTDTAADFEVVLEAQLSQLAPDVLFGRDNRLLPGERYRAVAFRKRRHVGQSPETRGSQSFMKRCDASSSQG
jgi:SAM-dependent methyltransferase